MTPPVGLTYQKGKICLTTLMMEATRISVVRRGTRTTKGIVNVRGAVRYGTKKQKQNTMRIMALTHGKKAVWGGMNFPTQGVNGELKGKSRLLSFGGMNSGMNK
jgi:cysteine sulfinate desulfinase/cysteine desulfurase-like protein